MKKEKQKGKFTVLNDRGLHTRPATELVKCSVCYKAQISLTYQKTTVNAKSILGILMLAAPKGAKIAIEAIGDDAEMAVQAIVQLAEKQFHHDY